jgi:hypothetical protein
VSYGARFTPVIVAGWNGSTLTGLFLLAQSRDGTTLCHVGAGQAEYQVPTIASSRPRSTRWPASFLG